MREPPATAAFVEPARLDRLQDRSRPVEARYRPGGPVHGRRAARHPQNPTSKLMLTILAGVATWEREIMLERQRKGIAKAKAAGKYTGVPSA